MGMGINRLMETLNKLFIHGFEALGKYYSTYNGIVLDVEDPEGRQRLRIKVPEITGNAALPVWVKRISNFSGAGYGSQCLPQVGDIVSVRFRYGNPRIPLWEHGYFGKDEQEDDDLKRYNNYWFKTPGGLKVCLDDGNEDNPQAIIINHPGGNGIRITDDTIDLIAPEGKTINLGTIDQAAEAALLGDTWEQQYSNLMDIILTHTHGTPFGPTTTPVNSQDFLDSKGTATLVKSTKNRLD